METFDSVKDFLDKFDSLNIESTKSNTFFITNGILPHNKTKDWQVIEGPEEPQIVIEVTPRWLSISINETINERKTTKRENFLLEKKLPKDPKKLIREVKDIIKELFE